MIKVSDYIMNALCDAGVEHVFTVSGGGIMHLVDSLGRHPKLNYVCNYHEQSCAIAAESYARLRHGLGACLVTTGPGGANAIPGIAGAWVDSVPVIVICGQVRSGLIADYGHLRQLGPQEINIEAMARPITKFTTTLLQPEQVRVTMEKAIAIAKEGRPGPVWVNVPLDVQGAMVDEATLPSYIPPAASPKPKAHEAAQAILAELAQARRPVLIGGHGIHLANAGKKFQQLSDTLGIPTLLTIGAMDLIPEEHPCFMGRFGPLGQRRANFTVQNADLLIAIGTSLSVSTIGFNTETFAPAARKIMVNIDPGEIGKAQPAPDIAFPMDASDVIDALLAQSPRCHSQESSWWESCRGWRNRYPTLTADYFSEPGHVNSYVFVQTLSEALEENDVILTGNSLDIWSCYHSFNVKPGQRLYTNINFGSMGWDLPAAVGAAVARHPAKTILITGDGSFLFSMHELQTIRHHQLNIKIFVLNNNGYDSIRTTQKTHFDGNLVGSDFDSGVSNPDYAALADAFGLKYSYIPDNNSIAKLLPAILSETGSTLCEINLSYTQGRSPKVISKRNQNGQMESGTLEDMYPFLPEAEVMENMAISKPQ